MSKNQYIETFSNIHPSDESIERIMNMTNKKHSVSFSKTLIVLVATAAILCSIGLVANAATDGAVAQTVSEAFETVSNKIIVLVNGKQTEADIKVTEKTNPAGEKYYEAEVNVETPDKDTEAEINVQLDGDTDVSDINSAMQESIKIYSQKNK